MKKKSSFTWEELSEILHIIKEERTVMMGALQRLKRIDSKLEDIESRIHLLIIKNDRGNE